MKNKIILAIIVLVLVVIGVYFGFKKSNTEVSGGDIKLGIITPMTGWPAFWGEDVKKAVDLAVSEVNQNGGIRGQNLSVIYEDMGPIDLKMAANAANKLVNVDRVSVLFTTFLEDTIVASPLAHSSNLPLVSIAGGNNGVELTKNLFRIRPYLEGVSPTESVEYFSKIGKKKPAIIFEELAYYVNYKEETLKAWTKIGITPKVYSSSGDARDAVLKAVSDGADIIYLRAPAPSQIEMIKRIKEVSPGMIIEGTELQDPAIFSAGVLTDGVFYVDYKPDPRNNFSTNFETKYGRAPGQPASLAYDAISAVKFALMKTELVNTESIIYNLKRVSFDGATGVVSFDNNKNRFIDSERVQLYQKIGGKFVEVI